MVSIRSNRETKQSEGILWVDNNNFQATFNLANELIKKKHKNIAFLEAKKTCNVTEDRFNINRL